MPDPDLLSGLIVLLLLAALGMHLLCITWHHRETLQRQVQLFVVAIVVRFAMSVAIYSLGLINVVKDEDGSGWIVGVAYHEDWMRRGIGTLGLPGVLLEAFSKHHLGYYYLLGAFFHVTELSTRHAAAALNCFFGALTIVFAYRIARTLFSEWVAIRTGWWSCLFPSLIIWSAQTIKEPVVMLLETIALYCCVQVRLARVTVRHFLLVSVCIVLLLPFRFYAAYITGVAVVLSLALPNVKRRKLSLGSSLALAGILGGTIAVSGLLAKQEARFGSFGTKTVQTFRESVSKGTGSGVESHYNLGTGSGFISGTAIGAAHLLLAPFPWQLVRGSERMMLTTPELLAWWYMIWIALIPGIRRAIRECFNDVVPLLFFICTLGLLYSAMFGNVGLAYRQRAQLIPWLASFAAFGLEERMLKRKRESMQPGVLVPIIGCRSLGTQSRAAKSAF